MARRDLSTAKVDGVLYWRCLCVCANPRLYHPSPRERGLLHRVIRAHEGNRRLRVAIQSMAAGIIQTCKQRCRLIRPRDPH